MCGRSKSAIINENGIGPTLIYTLCFILIEFHKLLSALKSILLFILFLAKNKTKYLFLSNQELTPTFCMKMKRAVSILIEGSVMNNATRPNAQFVHDILKHGILRQFVPLKIEERK